MTVEDIAKEIKSYDCRFLVVTGGEPLLQQEELGKLLWLLPEFYTEVETNGTIRPIKEFFPLVDSFIVSPKFENFSYAPIFSQWDGVTFKFVIDKEEDIKDVLQFRKEYITPYDEWSFESKREIYLMPQAKTTEERMISNIIATIKDLRKLIWESALRHRLNR